MEGTAVLKLPAASWDGEGEEVDLTSIVGHKRKITLNRCETCGSEEAKYRCPRCMKYSCSLPCVKKHKREFSCSGVRDKVAFIATSQFTDLNLLSDYRFLEDVGRSVDVAARDEVTRVPSASRTESMIAVCSEASATSRAVDGIQQLHQFIHCIEEKFIFLGIVQIRKMKREAWQRNINLILLPIGFTKRNENSTYFNYWKKLFLWHLKLLFPQSRAEYFARRVPEDKTLREILKEYIDPTASDPVIRQRLKAYVWSQSGVSVFMKVEKRKRDSVRYYELDCSKSLLQNLKNKTIIEYPTLYVALKEFKKDFAILGQERCTLSKPNVPSSMQ